MSQSPAEIQDNAQALQALYARLADHWSRDAADLLKVRPDVSAWSSAAHLFHIYLANELSLKNTASLVADKGMLLCDCEELASEAQAILDAGVIPRGRAEAPRFVTPPERVDLDLVRDCHVSSLQQLTDLLPRAEAISRAPRCIPHQLLGRLSAANWLRFALVHSKHHIEILDEIRGD